MVCCCGSVGMVCMIVIVVGSSELWNVFRLVMFSCVLVL